MKVVIVVPTYNECENVARLVPAIEQQTGHSPHDIHILVVDDSSPDGTADVVRRLQATHPKLHLLTGRKSGLGAAYIRGIRHAIDALNAEVIFEMDADFSHKPEDVPRLLQALEGGADFVIGSRYVAGGSIPAEWGLHRRLNSRAGNFVARYVAGIYQVRDCTAGFRAIRTTLLRQIDLDDLRVQGYAFQVALLHRAVSLGGKVKEIPVDFVERVQGDSKLGLRDIVEFIVNAWWIRLRSAKTFIKFLLVGASGVVVNLGAFTALLHLGLNKYVASPLAIELSIVTNFLLNNYWTFRWRRTKDRIRIKGLKFNAVSFVALGVSYTTFVALSYLFSEMSAQLAQLIAIAPATLVNYFLNSYWTFRDRTAKAPADTEMETRAEFQDANRRWNSFR